MQVVRLMKSNPRWRLREFWESENLKTENITQSRKLEKHLRSRADRSRKDVKLPEEEE